MREPLAATLTRENPTTWLVRPTPLGFELGDRDELAQAQARVADLALATSPSQLVLKIASPGVPDIYQGNELWDLRLVDPDNRTPVDFAARVGLLEDLELAGQGFSYRVET